MSVYAPDPAVIRDALLPIGAPVYHYFAMRETGDYIVWGEDGAADSLLADNGTEDQVLTGTVDLFTRAPENRTLFLAVQNALDAVAAWRLSSVQTEEDTGYTHYEWRWEVA